MSELRGTTQADFLIAIDADLQILDGSRCVFEESSFPVLELARSLMRWLSKPARSDFVFDSMSYEPVRGGDLQHDSGRMDLRLGVRAVVGECSSRVAEAERCVRSFVAQVEADLRELELDPEEVIGQ